MLSIIIPVYNGEKFIAKCLDSIFSQTYCDFQLIVVNDGSQDKSLEILNSYKEKYNNYDFEIISTENKGHGSARNTGIEKSNREYIWFIDCDDLLYNEHAFQGVVDDLVKKDPDIYIFSAFETDFKRRNKVWAYSLKNKMTNINKSPFLVFKQNWSWNKPIKRSFLISSGLRFSNEKMFEDTYFYVKLYMVAKTIYISNKIRYIYVKHDEALTSSLSNFSSYPKALLFEFNAFIKALLRLNKK
ncbi:glycosyltransferase involved in cell wall biosynthesis [Bacilli bacterium PM5-3]|nr:glycosyltransferase involved in cell wall biosynthesis [Bacilli bacterium PM5-3]MDH6603312.1 glycosyltransferase involved in cell wall biosynthesis [Bacilli bacterium PM5-9]